MEPLTELEPSAELDQELAPPASILPPQTPAQRLRESGDRLQQTRQSLLSAAMAYSDGLISEGQLRSIREVLREREQDYQRLQAIAASAARSEPPKPAAAPPLPSHPAQGSATSPLSPTASVAEDLDLMRGMTGELIRNVSALEAKLERLEGDFQQGRINASQYRAVRHHYQDQRQASERLSSSPPTSNRWKVILLEGKTTFLMQRNEADCLAFAIIDLASGDCPFLAGQLPDGSEEALSLLRTFSPPTAGGAQDHMYATETAEGAVLNLIPGAFTAALAAYSSPPPPWQVQALREIHLQFETANQAALKRGRRSGLIYPDLKHFLRTP